MKIYILVEHTDLEVISPPTTGKETCVTETVVLEAFSDYLDAKSQRDWLKNKLTVDNIEYEIIETELT